jgi:hypothetical protein
MGTRQGTSWAATSGARDAEGTRVIVDYLAARHGAMVAHF